ncbi:MAG: BatD family protein [Fidelibacterota bacterium]
MRNQVSVATKLIITLLIIFTTIFADDITVSASVNSSNITLNDILSYSVTIEGTRKISHLPQPEGKNFTVVNGPFQSSNIQIINGKMTTKKTYTWQLQPEQEGELVINGFSVMLDNKKYSANRIVVNVTQARYSTGNQQNTEQSNDSDSDVTPRIFMDAIPSKKEVYLGEQVIVEYKLIYNIRITNYATEKLPQAKGFWIEEFPDINNPQSNKIKIDGQDYYAATIKRIALFPTQSGELNIDPLITQCEVVLPRQKRSSNSQFDSFFDDPFFSNSIFDRTKVKRVVSSPLTIQVKPLPEYTRSDTLPPVMEGVRIAGDIDTTEILRDKALTLTYEISGFGNVNALELPRPQLPNYVEVFPPKINKETSNRGQKISGKASYEYVLIPHRAGKLEIPPVELTYFDPEREQYRTVSSQNFTVNVLEDENAITINSGLNKQEIQLLEQDIRYIMKGDVNWRKTGSTFYKTPHFVTINLLSFLFFVAGIGVNLHRKTIGNNPAVMRKTKAMKKARDKIHKAKDLPVAEALPLLDNALLGFIADRLNLPEAGLSPQDIKTILHENNVNKELVTDVFRYLENMELYKYSPGALSMAAEQGLKDQCKVLLSKLGRVI